MLAALRAQWAECNRAPGVPQKYYAELRAVAAARQDERDCEAAQRLAERESEVAQRLALVALRERLSADVAAECAALAAARERGLALFQELERLNGAAATEAAGGVATR